MDEQAKTPEYLSYDPQGFCDITLDRPVTLASGVEQSAMRMREPTVEDQITQDEMKGSEATKEVATMANLCEVAPDDIRRLPLKSYLRLQEAYRGFLH